MSLATAVFYTQAHRITGTVALRERLAEALNDPLTDYLELHDVRMSKLVDPEHREVQWPTTVVPKNEIIVATLNTEQHESAQSRRDKVTKKSGNQVACIVGTIELYGTAHLSYIATPRDILAKQLQPFFPITDATLLFPAAADSRQQNGLALANRSHVKAFSLL